MCGGFNPLTYLAYAHGTYMVRLREGRKMKINKYVLNKRNQLAGTRVKAEATKKGIRRRREEAV